MIAPRLLIVAAIVVLIQCCCGIQFYLEQGKKRCFTDHLPSETKVVAEYMVSAGQGEMKVNFQVRDAHGKSVYSKERIRHGKFYFNTPDAPYDEEYDEDYYAYEVDYNRVAHNVIKYEFCFVSEGEESARVTRRVGFRILKGAETRDLDALQSDHKLSNLEVDLESMNDELSELLKELEEVRLREENLRLLNEKTNKMVVTYSAIACVVMLAVGGYQLLYMRNYFRKKKLI